MANLLVLNKTVSAFGFSIPAGPGHCKAYDARSGSTCGHCYARQGRCIMPAALSRTHANLEAWKREHPKTLASMLAEDIGNSRRPIRWYVSGDFLSISDIHKLHSVLGRLRVDHAKRNRVWIPTRVWRLGANYVSALRNLASWDHICVRLSALMIDGDPPDLGFPVSRVVSKGLGCPKQQWGSCSKAGCRACWEKACPSIEYRLHGHRVK